MTRIVVIGIGNDWRGDDAVGLLVARAAGERLGASVDVVETDGEPSRLIEAWRDAETAIVVDAVRTGAAPGTVEVWDASIEAPIRRPRGSHALGLAEAIALGRAVQAMPARLTIVGVEVTDLGVGDRVSEPVASAVGAAVDAVVRAIQAGSRATPSG